MSDGITPIEKLVAEQEKLQRQHATLNAAPLSAITPETVDAAVEAAQAAGLHERTMSLNALKLQDVVARTDSQGVLHERREDAGARDLTAQPEVNPLADASAAALEEALAAIQTEKAGRPDGNRRVLPSVKRGRELAKQEGAIRAELHRRKGWRL
jgi:hypothetical protein